jgi:hypothetical protein
MPSDKPYAKLIEAVGRVAALATWREKERSLKPLDDKMEKALARVFARQGKIFLREFASAANLFRVKESAAADQAVAQAFATAEYETRAELVAAYEIPATAYATGRVLAVGADFKLVLPQALEWARANAAAKVAAVNDYTRSEINRLVNAGLEEGASPDKVARRIKGKFDEFSVRQPQQHIHSRAHLIAVTENRMAYEEGNLDAMRGYAAELGTSFEKAWMTVGSDACDDCLINEEEGWIPMEESFQDGSDVPPSHPACRCTTEYRMVI